MHGLMQILVPINQDNKHWGIVEVDMRQRIMKLYDSLREPNEYWKMWLEPLHTMLPLLLEAINYKPCNAQDVKKWYNKFDWVIQRDETCPQQETG